MKLNKEQLVRFIAEEISSQRSALLESPEYSIIGQEQEGDYTKDPDDYKGEVARRSLFHMSQQAQQLHDMLKADDQLEERLHTEIAKAAEYLEKAF